MHNQAAVLEKDTHKLLWNFDIHKDHLISTVEEGNQRLPFSYLRHRGVGEGATPFPGLFHLIRTL